MAKAAALKIAINEKFWNEKKGTYEIRSGALDFFPLADGSILVCYVSETKRIVPSLF